MGWAWWPARLSTAKMPSAEATWNALAAEWDAVDHGGSQVLFREIPYRGFVGVMRTEQGIFGASGAADQADLFNRLDVIVQ